MALRNPLALHSAHHAPPSRLVLVRRLARNAILVACLIAGAVGVGAAGYHVFDDLPWLDAALNAAMILTGMGPVSPLVGPAAKVWAIVYSLFSGVFFLTMVAVLLAPALHHFLHRFHLELGEPARAPAGRHAYRPRWDAASDPLSAIPVDASVARIDRADGGHR